MIIVSISIQMVARSPGKKLFQIDIQTVGVLDSD